MVAVGERRRGGLRTGCGPELFGVEVELDPAAAQLGFERCHEQAARALEAECEVERIGVADVGHGVGELHEFLVAKMLLDHRLVALKRGERSPEAILRGVGLAQSHEPAQPGMMHALGEVPQREESLGQIGQPGLLKNGAVGVEKLGDFHGRRIPTG